MALVVKNLPASAGGTGSIPVSPHPRHPESQPPGQERCFLMGVCMAFIGLNSGSGGP